MFSKTIIIGRLGQSPRFSTSKSGTSVCSFSMAVDTGYGDKKVTDWFSVTVFGKTAENCNRYLQKGSLVNVEGVVHLRKYQGKDGTEKSCIELVGNSVTFLSSRQDAPREQARQDAPREQATQPQSQPAEYFSDAPGYTADGLSPVYTQDGFMSGDVQNEDLPF